jgi:hypothetical protein
MHMEWDAKNFTCHVRDDICVLKRVRLSTLLQVVTRSILHHFCLPYNSSSSEAFFQKTTIIALWGLRIRLSVERLDYSLEIEGIVFGLLAGSRDSSLLRSFQTGSGAHPASYSMSTRNSFCLGTAAVWRCWSLTSTEWGGFDWEKLYLT